MELVSVLIFLPISLFLRIRPSRLQLCVVFAPQANSAQPYHPCVKIGIVYRVTSFLAPIAIVRSGFHCVYALHIPKSGFMSVDKRGTFFDKKFQFYYQNSLICFIVHASKSSCYLLCFDLKKLYFQSPSPGFFLEN